MLVRVPVVCGALERRQTIWRTRKSVVWFYLVFQQSSLVLLYKHVAFTVITVIFKSLLTSKDDAGGVSKDDAGGDSKDGADSESEREEDAPDGVSKDAHLE